MENKSRGRMERTITLTVQPESGIVNLKKYEITVSTCSAPNVRIANGNYRLTFLRAGFSKQSEQ